MTSRVPKKRKTAGKPGKSGSGGPTLRELNIMLEQSVAEKTAALKAAVQELDAFTHSVSHDLRAPLRHIAGFTDLLRTQLAGIDDPLVQRYIATVTDASVRMGEMIEKLLSLSRIGREPLHSAPLNLKQLADEVIGELQPLTVGRKIEWRVGDLAAVTADRALMAIALQNLLSNAVKFSNERVPAIIEISGRHEDGEYRIDVRDNGVGFDMRYADNLFRVFQRLHPPSEFAGIGVGLAIVKRIIEKHGGRVWAEGKPGAGATFHFALPAVR